MLGTVLLDERLYFCRSLALALPRLPFSRGIKGEGDFFFIEFPRLPCHLSHSSRETMRMRGDEIVLSFPSRPTPSPRLSSICLLKLFPRPRAWDVRAGGRFAAAGGTTVCLLPIVSCRSLAIARSLLLLGSPCGAVPIAPCRAFCLGCLVAPVHRLPVFLLKRFNEIRYPWLPFLLISFRHLVSPVIPSSHFLGLLLAFRLTFRPASRPASRFAARLSSRPFVPFSPC